jgi:hypothetical protein
MWRNRSAAPVAVAFVVVIMAVRGRIGACSVQVAESIRFCALAPLPVSPEVARRALIYGMIRDTSAASLWIFKGEQASAADWTFCSPPTSQAVDRHYRRFGV